MPANTPLPTPYASPFRSGSPGPVAAQRSLMPPPRYTGGFVDTAAAIRPCRLIGGDFYDFLDNDQEFHVLFGDACGKGTPAALTAALAQGILAGAVKAKAGPASVVAHVNRALWRRGVAQRFLTLFYGVMTRDHRLTYCNAGQCRPMLVDGSSVRRLGAGGPPPGLLGDAEYEEESLSIASGDTLVVFSDGVPEAENHEQEFGDARIHEIVARYRTVGASAIRDRLVNAVTDFTRGSRQRDDMAVLVVRYLA
jgi:sigma-B regulation protein RsbU (phosphoserine phosphatase)